MIDEVPALSKTGIPASHDHAKATPRSLTLELLIGSNIFRNTNGVVTIQGKEQLVIEFQPEQGLLLMTMDLYNEKGLRIAHLRRNVFRLNLSEQFAVETHQPQHHGQGDYLWVRVTDRRSGMPLIETHMVSAHRVHIVSGKFYSHQGTPVEVTPNYCRIGTSTTLFGEVMESRGGMAVLGTHRSTSSPTQP